MVGLGTVANCYEVSLREEGSRDACKHRYKLEYLSQEEWEDFRSIGRNNSFICAEGKVR